eukprot:m.17071 g.17071  ORF g.17071 m.17071 type:complete len:537 (+) comp5382_c0_seq1:271-1881(+)
MDAGADPGRVHDVLAAHVAFAVYGLGSGDEGMTLSVARHTVSVVAVRTSENLLAAVLHCPDTDTVFIAFRGTQSLDDWKKTNLRTRRVKFMRLPAKVHQGFLESYLRSWVGTTNGEEEGCVSVGLSLHDQLMRELSPLSPSSLVFCGHSLGGALATICAAASFLQPGLAKPLLQHQTPPRRYLTTFGCPRVGCATFKNFLSQLELRSRRFVAVSPTLSPDLITQFPRGTDDETSTTFAHVTDPHNLHTEETTYMGLHKMSTYVQAMEDAFGWKQTKKSFLISAVLGTASQEKSASENCADVPPTSSPAENPDVSNSAAAVAKTASSTSNTGASVATTATTATTITTAAKVTPAPTTARQQGGRRKSNKRSFSLYAHLFAELDALARSASPLGTSPLPSPAPPLAGDAMGGADGTDGGEEQHACPLCGQAMPSVTLLQHMNRHFYDEESVSLSSLDTAAVSTADAAASQQPGATPANTDEAAASAGSSGDSSNSNSRQPPAPAPGPSPTPAPVAEAAATKRKFSWWSSGNKTQGAIA